MAYPKYLIYKTCLLSIGYAKKPPLKVLQNGFRPLRFPVNKYFPASLTHAQTLPLAVRRNNFRWNWSRRKLINLHLTYTNWIFLMRISIFFPAIIHKKCFKKHFNVVCLFFNKIVELNGWAVSTLSPRKKVIKTNLLRAAWLPKVYSPRLLFDKEVEEELHFGYICSANTSCTLLSHNCFRFRYKSNRNLIRFLPRPNNKLHNFKAEISGRKHRVEKGRGKYMKEFYSRLYFK